MHQGATYVTRTSSRQIRSRAQPPLPNIPVVFLDQRQTASLLNLSERTLERFRLEGTGPAYCKFGRRVMYARADVLELGGGQRVAPPRVNAGRSSSTMHTPTISATAYQASHARRRVCSTKAEVTNRRKELCTIVLEKKPTTWRHGKGRERRLPPTYT